LSPCLSIEIAGSKRVAMINKVKKRIFFVDNEPSVRRAVGRTLKQLGSKVNCFANAADCLEQLRLQSCDLLITDVKMPGMDGIELVCRAKRLVPWLPVLVVTGYGDIPLAVRAIKVGAVNFIEKPLERHSFLAAVESALEQNSPYDGLLGKAISKAEKKVLRLLLDGRSNKEIAHTLHRSIRTVEVHRRNIMRKLNVDSVAGLVKRAAKMGLVNLKTEQ